MVTHRPATLRWAEQAEAEQVCALAVLEPEPESGAVRPVGAAPLAGSTLWPNLLLRWLGLFGGGAVQGTQIRRDEKRQHSL